MTTPAQEYDDLVKPVDVEYLLLRLDIQAREQSVMFNSANVKRNGPDARQITKEMTVPGRAAAAIQELRQKVNELEGRDALRSITASERDDTITALRKDLEYAKAGIGYAEAATLLETVDRVTKQRDAALEALKPFAEEAEYFGRYDDDYVPLSVQYTVGDLRRAASLVS